jgi:hypothetical protein
MDLDAYRHAAESFLAELTGEYYRHYAGLQDEYEIEAIYARHGELFTAGAVSSLRERRQAVEPGAEEGRRLRMLVDFAVEGYVGEQTKAAEAELARREADLVLELEGESIGFRESSVVQANEPDPERRARIEEARLEAAERELSPLHVELTERQHEAARSLGWPSYFEMCVECKGVDYSNLAEQTAAFSSATDQSYPAVLGPEVGRTLELPLDELRRSDLPRFFRAADQDGRFPEADLLPSFLETMRGLGVDVRRQTGVVLDVEPRPKKSPRAFCAPVRTPGEVYLMLTPVGGREDFSVLMHEGGHAEHAAHVDPGLPFEFRCLGDNAITECFAFLLQHLVESPAWLQARLGIDDADELVAYARANRLVYLRRYAAKLAYELELHGPEAPAWPELASRYSELLGSAVGVPWPRQTFLSDVDPGFYSACYLRAWALETHLRAHLRSRHGDRWFESAAAGDELKALWRQGQRLSPEELLGQLTGEALDFRAMLADLGL